MAVFETGRVWTAAASAVVILAMVAYTAHEGFWLANVNNRAPTSIDGAWEVQGPQAAGVPAWIYFEYNRAYMVVFRFADGHTETHDFRADDAAKTLQLGSDWLTPGTDIFAGTWTRSNDTMTLRGDWRKATPITLSLKRKPMQIKDHR